MVNKKNRSACFFFYWIIDFTAASAPVQLSSGFIFHLYISIQRSIWISFQLNVLSLHFTLSYNLVTYSFCFFTMKNFQDLQWQLWTFWIPKTIFLPDFSFKKSSLAKRCKFKIHHIVTKNSSPAILPINRWTADQVFYNA